MPSKPKIRLDQFLVNTGRCNSKNQAQGLILAGKVRVGQTVVSKPGSLFHPEKLEATVISIEEGLRYVSRGGLKLEKALEEFNIKPIGYTCMDIGASTGGFTDCLLQNGATKVFSIDVGHGQLDWKLRQDERVVCLEKTNIKHFTTETIPDPISLCVMDISFISIKKAFPTIETIFKHSLPDLTEPPILLSLIKPQFEYRDYCSAPGFDGVVKDSDLHEQILKGILGDIETQFPAFSIDGLSFSPITGPKGNLEFLLYCQYKPIDSEAKHDGNKTNSKLAQFDIQGIIQMAHQSLLKGS